MEIFEKIPFSATILSSIVVYGFGLPVFVSNQNNEASIILVTVVFAILGAITSIATIIFLFRSVTNVNVLKQSAAYLDVFAIFNVWFTLMTAQTAVLYIPYMFDPINAFRGIGSTNGPWYVYAKLFYVICGNFHGASGAGVEPLSAFAILWLAFCSIMARIFLFIAVPLLFFLLKQEYQKLEQKNKQKV